MATPVEQWRFINSGALPGALNMAIDMAVAQAAAKGAVGPTLRIYNWAPPAISLGYHQSENDIELNRCRADGIDVVLRPTGGRAIFHVHELTYAVVLPPASKFYAPDVQSVYEIISRCLVTSLKQLDVDVEFERAAKTPKDFARGELSTLCYASSVQYEIGIGRRKLVGSAQRRINGAVLQHGSLLISDEHLRITQYLAAKDEAWRARVKNYMENITISLNQASGRIFSFAQVADALYRGFQQELGIQFTESDLTPAELEHAQQLECKFSILAHQVEKSVTG